MSVTSSIIGYFADFWSTSPYLCIASILFGLLLTAIIWAQVEQLVNHDDSQPPMVWYWIPFIGSMITFGIQPMTFMRKNRAKYGDYFTFLMFGKRMTVCLGVEGNSFVFNAKHSHVNAEDAYNHLTKPVFGAEVVYDVPNHVLMEQKKMGKIALTNENFKKYIPMIIEETNLYIKEHLTKDSDTIDIFKAVSELIIMTASRTLMGPEIRAQLFTGVAELYTTLDASFTPIHFLFEWLPLPSYYNCETAHNELNKIFGKIINDRRAQTDKKYDDMLNVFMTYVYKDGNKLTDLQVTNLMIAFLMAGQHTSSATTTWSLLNLSNNHDLIDQLYAQMKDVMGDDLPYPEFEDLNKMPMLQNIVKETLRTNPPIIQILRKVTKPIAIPKTNYIVPAENYLLSSPAVTQSESEYFIDPESYMPSRWETKSEFEKIDEDLGEATTDYGFGSMNSKSAKSPYLPFGAGRHRCIGEQFAHIQVQTILFTLIKHFDFTLDEKRGMPKPDYNSMVILPEAPCILKYTRRNKL
ncbi:hypothetical protein BB561_003573 [Smittium simulii]|uniref:Lanosterol 14-alpha demethylase n=1 Tax=Smittium simulii TaxID=133385 RepID=A0A2T9YKK2_9FUNG|nr:hypothetical protein BB561_003573 [Smittium simulii]